MIVQTSRRFVRGNAADAREAFEKLKDIAATDPAFENVASSAALFFPSPFSLHAALKQGSQIKSGNPPALQTAAADAAPAPEPTEQSAEKNDLPLFEPLHATDYFASQGIKLSEAEAGADKLGTQLKTFTAWLKTMKKLHGDRLPPPGIAVETAIQTLAEKSNIDQPVITEAMAQAFEDQGKTERAREIYHKLSLLDPSKSGYFAAKIDNLKGHS